MEQGSARRPARRMEHSAQPAVSVSAAAGLRQALVMFGKAVRYKCFEVLTLHSLPNQGSAR
jgi:hypothetical protein